VHKLYIQQEYVEVRTCVSGGASQALLGWSAGPLWRVRQTRPGAFADGSIKWCCGPIDWCWFGSATGAVGRTV